MKRAVNYKGRLGFLRALFVILAAAVVARLFVVQVVEGHHYHVVAQDQYQSRVTLKASRGMIFDRNGSLMVSNIYGYSYAADPQLLNTASKTLIAGKFSGAFGIPESFFLRKLNEKSQFVWLERDIEPGQAAALQNLNVYGLIRLQDQQRLYPYGQVAGQVLGFTNVDGRGASGVEMEFDTLLAGKNGYEVMQLDGAGRRMPSVDYPRVRPVPGDNVRLTLDLSIQQIVEQELAAGVAKAQAKDGTAVFINPNTGEILAMADYPPFDPGNYDQYPIADSRNRAITDVFEPGSTFKVVTASAALEEGIETPSDMIYTDNGRYPLYGRIIQDYMPQGWISFRRAIETSSDIAFSKIGQKIGADRYYRYARDFGFGEPTGIALPGEVPGVLYKPYQWSKLSLPFMAFGYGVMVTTLQMAQAYGAIANGGTLMMPYIIDEITAPDGKVIFQNRPTPIRRVVTKDVSQTLSGLLVDVVEHGTGVYAKLPNLLIAGKTGTAEKLVDGKYSKKFYHASFAGFFPVPNPQIVGYIMIDSPTNGYTGGMVAAPVFKRIAERIYGIIQRRTTQNSLNNLELASDDEAHVKSSTVSNVSAGTEVGSPSNESVHTPIRVPDVLFLDRGSAETILNEFGFNASGDGGKGFIVTSEKPTVGSLLSKGETVHLTMQDAKLITRMPDFRGGSVRKATSFLLSAGIPFQISGSGRIVSQIPNPGDPVDKKATVKITCSGGEVNLSELYK